MRQEISIALSVLEMMAIELIVELAIRSIHS